jgi:hypothetical protein
MNMSDKMVEIPENIIEEIHYHLTAYDDTRSRANAAFHLIELFNHVSDLSSYHSGYDDKSGTMPWQRDDE